MFQKSHKILLILCAFVFAVDPALGQSNIANQFSGHDPNSNVRIDHEPLHDYLQATVLPVGRSYRLLGNEKAESYRGSRIKTAKSLTPSRFEGNRLLIHAFTDDHRAFFKAYQEGLERLSNRRPLRELNKNEQMAFWLNLYNVVVINKVIEEYPVEKLKGWRSSKRGKKSFWDQKVTTIEGVSLSLKDIENILFANFDKPEVAFGLWQGSVGGPRLLNYAFTGRNVNRALENNALEFVNSNRGLRNPTGSRMNVSDFYEWMMPAFGTSEAHVLSFIKEYADPNFVGGVSAVSSLNFKIYDWRIADLIGGTRHSGQHVQMGGVLGGGNGGPQASRGSQQASFGTEGTVGRNPLSATPGAALGGTTPVLNVIGNLNSFLDKTPTGPLEGLPPYATELLNGMRLNARRPIPVITSEECAPGETCVVERYDDDDG